MLYLFKGKERPEAKLARSEIQEEEECTMPAAQERSSKPMGSSTGKATKKEACRSTQGSKQEYSHWLMKSEPESRFEKGVDVKVSTGLPYCYHPSMPAQG